VNLLRPIERRRDKHSQLVDDLSGQESAVCLSSAFDHEVRNPKVSAKRIHHLRGCE
jgi:hypothetical protein